MEDWGARIEGTRNSTSQLLSFVDAAETTATALGLLSSTCPDLYLVPETPVSFLPLFPFWLFQANI